MAFIDQYMCSTDCPCPMDHHDIVEEDIDEATLNKKYKRTWKEKNKGFNEMIFGTEDGGKEYEVFETCFNEKFKENGGFGKPPLVQAGIKEFPDRCNRLRYYEEEFDCSGMCDVPLFYSTKAIMDGLPEEDCIDAIIENVLNNKICGIVAGITGCLFLLCGLCSIPCGGGGSNKKHKKMAEDDWVWFSI